MSEEKDFIPNIDEGSDWEIESNPGHGAACSFKHKTLPLTALLRFDHCTHLWWQDKPEPIHTDDFPALIKALTELLGIMEDNWP